VNGEKMSKGLGNFLPPGPLVEQFGADVLRYYLMREVGFGHDGDFSHKNLMARYNGELANGLGNLLNRILPSFVQGKLGGAVPRVALDSLADVDRELIALTERVTRQTIAHMESVAIHRALESIWELVAAANKYVGDSEPWNLSKRGELERLAQVCYVVLETLRWLSVLLWPFMPDKADALRTQLGLSPVAPTPGDDQLALVWGGLEGGTPTAKGAPLFPRIEAKDEETILAALGLGAAETPAPPAKKEGAAARKGDARPTIEFDDFAKVDLRVGLVLAAERLPKSKKLLKLSIDVGEPSPRQILAGISEHYAPEALTGRRVLVVCNLAPRKMMGVESQGMVVAASDDQGLSILTVDKELAPGSPAR